MKKFSSIKSDILLEAGTNELEILIFTVAGQRYGVNVAKIREVLEVPDVRSTAGNCSHATEGVARVRDFVVPIADLCQCIFPGEPSDPKPTDQLLLLEFNEQLLGFRVRSVENILRVSWKDILPLPDLVGDALVTGVAQLGADLIPMLDFESIGVSLGVGSITSDQDGESGGFDRSQIVIAYADDSPLIRELMKVRLTSAGFTNLREFRDGLAAWEFLHSIESRSQADELIEHIGGLVSDIEMPQMDGLTLTRKVRESSVLNKLPVILFSSIASDANENKALQVGADAQISKSNSLDLTAKLSELISERMLA